MNAQRHDRLPRDALRPAPLIARPIEAAGFAAFGEVTPRPASPPAAGRTVVAPLGIAQNLRDAAAAGLAWFAVPASAWPVTVRTMERHRHSSQSFVPCGPADWLVVVAPHGAGDGPDMARAEAFVATAATAVTIRPDVWHHPLTAFAAAGFAVLTFLVGDADDEEFRSLVDPVTILAPPIMLPAGAPGPVLPGSTTSGGR